MARCVLKRAEHKGGQAPGRGGFTLVEAVVATALAAMGFALVFQGLGGAARLLGASGQSARAVLVASSVLAEAMQEQEETSDEGVTDGIAWTVTSSVLVQRGDGVRLLRYTVLAEGVHGRQVRLVSERTVPAMDANTP